MDSEPSGCHVAVHLTANSGVTLRKALGPDDKHDLFTWLTRATWIRHDHPRALSET